MSALLYILRKSAKNSLRELIKKPAKLVMYILVAAAIVAVVALSLITKAHVEQPAPMFWFTGILFLFVTMFGITSVVNGLSGGGVIFEMNDVNLLFVSPVNPRKILMYGVVKMAKAAFAAGFFILFQTNSLANFGVDYTGVLLTFAGFLLSVVALTILSLLIYSVSNGRPGRKRFVKCLTALMFIPLLVFAVSRYLETRDVLATLEAAIKSPFLQFIPVAGWTPAGITAVLSGETAHGLMLLGLNLVLGAGIIIYIALSNPDYYEDVLVATETAYEKKRAMAEGNIDAASANKKAVKITKTGIPGSGAASLFGKHMRESFRQSRFGFLTTFSFFMVIGAVVFAYFTRDLFITMQVLVWMQFLLIGTGRGLKETYSHYIYLIPESSFKKILWSNMEIMARTLIENVLIFGIAGALIRAGIGYILICITVYTLFSFVLLGINYLSMRFTGANLGAGLLITFYFLAVILALLPGIAAAIIIGLAVGGDGGFAVGMLVMSAWELIAGLGCFALSKGVLHTCDMAMLKNTGK